MGVREEAKIWSPGSDKIGWWSGLLGVVGRGRAGVCTSGSEGIRLSLSVTPGCEGRLTSGPLDLTEEG